MKRQYRLRSNRQFQEIRRRGESTSNQLLVLCVAPNDLPHSRFGFSVSKRIGNAVVRNRIKRRLREAVRIKIDQIRPGWDLIFIARNPIRQADYHQMDDACARLIRRAQLFIPDSSAGAGPSLAQKSAPLSSQSPEPPDLVA